MKKVFWDNPYQTELNTKVKAVSGNQILLEDTIIFSFSGGQESDKAFINKMPVLDSNISEHLIYYTVPHDHSLQPGDVVHLEIDWVRRYRLMRLHFAAELILELITQYFSLEKIGAHISENKSRVDFIYDKNIAAHFDFILDKYNKIIDSDLLIIKGYLDEKTERRFWKIEGFAEVPCGGTHVKSTKEVGYVKLKRKNIGGGKERIEISLLNEAG